jgi:hypothetical protein
MYKEHTLYTVKEYVDNGAKFKALKQTTIKGVDYQPGEIVDLSGVENSIIATLLNVSLITIVLNSVQVATEEEPAELAKPKTKKTSKKSEEPTEDLNLDDL